MSYNENLKLFAAYYVVELEIPEENKLQLIEFIKSGTAKQVEHLLCTGLVKNNLTKEEQLQEIDSSFKEWLNEIPNPIAGAIGYGLGKAYRHVLDKSFQAGMHQGVGGAVAAAALIAASVLVYKRFMSKAARSCKGSGAEKTACMRRFKIDAKKKQIGILTSSMPKCKNTKNPEKCTNKIKTKINLLKVATGQ